MGKPFKVEKHLEGNIIVYIEMRLSPLSPNEKFIIFLFNEAIIFYAETYQRSYY